MIETPRRYCHSERSEESPPFMFSRGSLDGGDLQPPQLKEETPRKDGSG